VGQIGYLFNIIFSFPILNVLMLLDHVFGDFGLSIVVLTLVIRLCLFPLTLKQLRSTKATQAIQPLMADIKKKYPDQREQYAEMQRLYKEYNINPVAGCLPLVIQMPIIYGLYRAMEIILTPTNSHLLSLADLNNLIYPFLPKFLVMPDFALRWFTFLNPHWYISLASADPTHILPVLAGLATFAQLRMSQARAAQQRTTGGASNMMTNQMQIMSFVMPFVTFFIALNFPSGLALYWTTTSVFSMVQQYFVTGWGSLFTLPSFLGGSSTTGTPKVDSKTSVSETRRERASLDRVVDSSAEVVSEKSTRTTGNGGYSNSNGSSTRRRRPNSASARRRGNVPKRNASRS
jgi:YidC/Oxa1 family membrane protein insertase